MDTLTELSAFAGFGGTSLGLKLWGELAGVNVRTVCYVEIEKYCQRILEARIRDGCLDDAPIWDDVTTFDGRPWAGRVDIISGGFPCQDISCAGKGAGLEGQRSGLFYEIMRLAGEIRPRFLLLENVSAIYVRGIDAVLGALAEAGYDARWTSVRASDVGAPHRRERWFCLAYLQGNGMEGLRPEGEQEPAIQAGSEVSGRECVRNELWPLGYGPEQHEWEPERLTVANAKQRGRKEGRQRRSTEGIRGGGQDNAVQAQESGGNRPTQSRLGVCVDGRSHRVDRLRALGNGIVPQQLAAALTELFAEI